MNDKNRLDLFIELFLNKERVVTMTKTLYASFVPQHGMDILDTEIFFKVRTTSLAGLQALKHTASPLRKGGFIEGNRKITSKLFSKDQKMLEEAIEFFYKQGWVVQK